MTPRFYVEIYIHQPPRSWFGVRPDSQWRWRAKGMNHEIMATGEGYSRLSDAKDTIEALFGSDVVIKRIGL